MLTRASPQARGQLGPCFRGLPGRERTPPPPTRIGGSNIARGPEGQRHLGEDRRRRVRSVLCHSWCFGYVRAVRSIGYDPVSGVTVTAPAAGPAPASESGDRPTSAESPLRVAGRVCWSRHSGHIPWVTTASVF